jgi:hypothetical protein
MITSLLLLVERQKAVISSRLIVCVHSTLAASVPSALGGRTSPNHSCT